MRFGSEDRPVPVGWLLAAAAVSLPLALAAPLGLAVAGFMLFGVAHNLAELRYVMGRYAVGRVDGGLALAVGGPLLLVMGARASGGWLLEPTDAKQAEIALMYGAMLAVVALRSGPAGLRVALLGLIGLGAWASWTWPRAHFLVLSHLHNAMPAIFLLLHHRVGRGRVALANLVWVAVIPALLLTGAFDAWMAADGLGAVGPLDRPRGLFGGWIPVGADEVETLRVVATFSFLQGMHYAIWIGLLPRVSGARTGGGRLGAWLFGRPGTVAAIAVGVGLLPLFATRYLDAFSAYGVLSSFHALVEFPVLLAFLLDRTAQPGPRVAAA